MQNCQVVISSKNNSKNKIYYYYYFVVLLFITHLLAYDRKDDKKELCMLHDFK